MSPSTSANDLIHELSPYLLQHAHNPVRWMPWGEEAFRRARKEDKPIFLSAGYASCHWCHVMAHESFESDAVAEKLNKSFIPVKVDREQRPDVDHLYMLATQLMSGQGGWPNSVWLTPEGEPWLAGTFFPRDDVAGRPGFLTLLDKTARMWSDRREEVTAAATHITQRLRQYAGAEHLTSIEAPPPDDSLLPRAVEAMVAAFDDKHGGFGNAPKFPPSGALELLMRHAAFHDDDGPMTMVTRTLDAMADGGMHDHLAGGFHRYSTDAQWHLPHFEKMLYDNARLAEVYAAAAVRAGNPRYARVAQDVCDWVLTEMPDPAGAFRCALDADTEQGEGRFYTWSMEEIIDVLGPTQGELWCRAYGVRQEGNFREEATGEQTGLNVLHREVSDEILAREQASTPEQIHNQLQQMREKLLEHRNTRPRPAQDDKVLTAWNGLMISALARAGAALDRPDYVGAAREAARFVLNRLTEEPGRVLRAYRNGKSDIRGFLDDHAFLARGLLALHAAEGEEEWLTPATQLADTLLEHFRDEDEG
ncbi:MAG: thioredoxin domain-containing protein, partial [Phycisphaerae bacterium]